jgi:hypothetical protein
MNIMQNTQIDTQTPPAWMRLLSPHKATRATMAADEWNESEAKQAAWISKAIAEKNKGRSDE